MKQDNLLQFTASLDKFQGQLDAHLDELYRNVAFVVAENVVVGGEFAGGTPIDTGFARASWVVGLGTPGTAPFATGKGEAGKDYTGEASAKMASIGPALLEAKIGQSVFLTNHCAYIMALENGHSQQAPYGMVELTLANAQQIVDRVAQQMGAKF